MGIFDMFRKTNIDMDKAIEFDFLKDVTDKIHMKRLAIQTCVNMIAKAISQTEFKTIENKEAVKGSLYYRLNVKPNQNMSASHFWQVVVSKLVYENECLIVVSDTNDFLIADSFEKQEYAVYQDVFSHVVCGDYEFKRTFLSSEVIYLQLNNDNLMDAIDGLYSDYGELFGRIMDFQKRKGQIRGVVNMETITGKDEKSREKIQEYINRIYKSFRDNTVSVIPQQKGYEYKEIGVNQPLSSVDEVTKVTDGFLNQIAKALGIPIALLIGEMADVEKQTKNFMLFCINPLLRKITDELTASFYHEEEFLAGSKISAVGLSYNNLFDVASSVDKLVSSGTFTINQIREKLGEEPSDDEICDTHFITKNYQTLEENAKSVNAE